MNHSSARQAGFSFPGLPIGPMNGITDVAGVQVGHSTLIEGEQIRTGVTAIIPHTENLFTKKTIASSFVLNGFGKTTGLVQVEELGVIESPIMLTNTFSVPAVTEGTLSYLLAHNQEIGTTTSTVNVLTAECNDGFLNDIRQMVVKPKDAISAIKAASGEAVEEGAVGAGTGMSCLGFKGGIGTSSRLVSSYTVGCLVLTNYGQKEDWIYSRHRTKLNIQDDHCSTPMPDGSIIIVLATDAPLDARQLKRLAKRATLGLGRTASFAANGSGDIAIAFSTVNRVPHYPLEPLQTYTFLHDSDASMSLLFAAAAECVEEAILNSLCSATTTTGYNKHTRLSIHDALTK
ncbi:DmpA family aminopeptidase [Shouchella lehensis]|uniref:S58 family peptidase n=1 Tax=Shouchella lehensis TaxID=300825 RepID=A0A4Y7WMJ3_9BACI|nr:P1 family peptidase [Shouchella lehensis]MBG9782757.1 D-aminopeptidase [Shouchella lehensis]TES49906.1 S58 family peptidase [Shouchella lehensis]